MSLTEAELAVERDWLLEHGRSVEEVEAMQALSDPEWVRLLESWGEQSGGRPWTDHACCDCVREGVLRRSDWRCLWHRAVALRVARLEREHHEDMARLSRTENAAGASAHRAPGETG